MKKTILLFIEQNLDGKVRAVLAKDKRPYMVRQTKHGLIMEALKINPEDIRAQAAVFPTVMHETGNSMRLEVTPEIHAEQKDQAEALGVTLNTLINLKIANHVQSNSSRSGSGKLFYADPGTD